jgi:hypothetical protein
MVTALSTGVYRIRTAHRQHRVAMPVVRYPVSADVTAPTLQSATIDAAGTTLTLVFDEAVTNATETDGWDLRSFGGARTLSGGSGSGTNTHTLTISPSVLQGERVILSYDSSTGSAVDASANALADIAFAEIVTNNSTQTITRPTIPSYTGFPKLTGLTTITPKISIHKSGTTEPCFVQVSADGTTVNSGVTSFNSVACDPFMDLHYEWDFGDTGGNETALHHWSGQTIDLDDEQIGAKANYVYRSAGTYTITLTAKGKNDSGTIISASTTTLLQLGEYEYFDGGATSGTFTITVDGQTTSAIAYDATTATIVAAIEALSSVGAGNVRDTGYHTFQFIGDLAGQAVTITGNFGSLVGVGTGGSAPDIIERIAPSSSSSVTVTDLSGWTEAYFDSNAAGGGDGSIGTPYNTFSELDSFLDTAVDSSDNKVAYIKRGSSFAFTQRIKWGDNTSGRKILPYGTGAAPILTDSAVSGGNIGAVMVLTAHSASTRLVSEFVVAGMDCRGQRTSEPFIYASSQALGTLTEPRTHISGIVVADCTFTRSAGTGSMVLTDNGCAGRLHGMFSYNNEYLGGDKESLAHYNPNAASWVASFADTYSGGLAETIPDATRFHHIYPKMANESCFKYITFGPAYGLFGFCINMNSYGDGASRRHLIHGCNATGTQNGFDASNLNNNYDDPDEQSFFTQILWEFNLVHSGQIYLQENGIVPNNLHDATVRYNDFWNNIDTNVFSSDSANTVWRMYYNNSYEGKFSRLAEANAGYLFNNKCYSTSVSDNTALQIDSLSVTVGDWDIDENIWYAPNTTAPFYDRDTTSYLSFATWQSTYSVDDNGSNADPLFSDPEHGVMEYTWASPSYSDTTKPTVQSASISTAGAFYTIVYDEPVTGQTGHTLSATGGAVTLAPSSGDTTDTHVWSLDRTILKTETVTRSYTPGNAQDGSGNTLDAYSGQAVTNGSGMPRPTVSTAAIDVAGDELSLMFPENVTGQLGWSLTATDGAVTATGDHGNGTESHSFSLSRVIGSHEVVTLAYDSATGNAVDDDGLEVADFSGLAVTNNSTVDTTAPEVTAFAIGTNGTTVTITYDKNVLGQTGFTLTATGGAVTISAASGNGTTSHVFTASRTIGSHETVTAAYDSATGNALNEYGTELEDFSGLAVTNGSTQDTLAPTLVAAQIIDSGDTLQLVFSENVTGQTGFSLTASGGAVTLSAPSGDTTETHTFALSRTIADNETVTLDYDSGTGTSQDDAGNALATITDRPVSIGSGAEKMLLLGVG